MKTRMRRIHQAKRRSIEKDINADSIDPFNIFDRDGWHCYLCGIETPKKLRGTRNDAAPELDHIVPIAHGGTHTVDNVACACRKCNRDKGARLPGDMPNGFLQLLAS